jgi:hypothetical protein
MKKTRMFGLVILVALAFGAFQLASADDKSGSTPSQDQGWFCPWAGQYGMGPGMMWNRGDSDEGTSMGPSGMMGSGRGYGYGHHSYNRSGKSVTMDQAKVLVEHYLTTIGNPNLKSGKIADKDKYFEVEIVTKEGSLVDKLMLDKQTGWMKSVY